MQGDITELDVDAIVNAAGPNLVMGGGVAGAILRKGGQAIQDACDKVGHTPTGTAIITGAGRLKAKHVIHAVGPIMGEGNEDEKLKSAVEAALAIAFKKGLRAIAFPAISAGIFGFPKQRCAEVMIHTTLEHLAGKRGPEAVIIILYDEETYGIFEKEYKRQAKDS